MGTLQTWPFQLQSDGESLLEKSQSMGLEHLALSIHCFRACVYADAQTLLAFCPDVSDHDGVGRSVLL